MLTSQFFLIRDLLLLVKMMILLGSWKFFILTSLCPGYPGGQRQMRWNSGGWIEGWSVTHPEGQIHHTIIRCWVKFPAKLSGVSRWTARELFKLCAFLFYRSFFTWRNVAQKWSDVINSSRVTSIGKFWGKLQVFWKYGESVRMCVKMNFASKSTDEMKVMKLNVKYTCFIHRSN